MVIIRLLNGLYLNLGGGCGKIIPKWDVGTSAASFEIKGDSNMSFEAFRQEQPTSQSGHVGHSAPATKHLNLADQLRFRQMERMLRQTLEELGQAKARISQLEKTLAERAELDAAACGSSGQQTPASLTPPLPIAEISQIAKMAKRFK